MNILNTLIAAIITLAKNSPNIAGFLILTCFIGYGVHEMLLADTAKASEFFFMGYLLLVSVVMLAVLFVKITWKLRQ